MSNASQITLRFSTGAFCAPAVRCRRSRKVSRNSGCGLPQRRRRSPGNRNGPPRCVQAKSLLPRHARFAQKKPNASKNAALDDNSRRAHPCEFPLQQTRQTKAKTHRHDNAQAQPQGGIHAPWFLRNHSPNLKFNRQSSRFKVSAPSAEDAGQISSFTK